MKNVKSMVACSALVLACAALTARADDPKPAIIARASISSIDDLKKVITDLGIPLPVDPQGMMEMQFPFIGAGGVQSDKPVGIAVVAGETIDPNDSMVITVPVVAGKADVTALTKANGQPVPGHDDMVSIAGKTMHRTANYLMMAGLPPDILALVPDGIFAQDYTKPGRFAMISVDIAAFRAAAPTRYKAYLDMVANQQVPGLSAAGGPARDFVDKLDQFRLALGHEQNDLHIEAWLQPTEFNGSRTFPKPAFPAGIVAQTNVAYPDAKSADWMVTLVNGMPDSSFQDAQTDAAHAPRAKALVAKIAKFFDADAVSLAVEIDDGKPLVYLVEQYAGDRDLAKEIPPIVDEGNALSKDTNDDSVATVSTYQNAAGKTVTRLTMSEKDKPQGYMDCVQIDHTAYFTFAADDGKHIDAIDALPANGQMSALCSGSVDLAACLKASQASGGAPLPPEMLKEMTAAFAGQSITWSAKAGGATKDLDLELSIPFPVLQEAGKMVTQYMGGGGPPPANGGGPQPQEQPAPPPAAPAPGA